MATNKVKSEKEVKPTIPTQEKKRPKLLYKPFRRLRGWGKKVPSESPKRPETPQTKCGSSQEMEESQSCSSPKATDGKRLDDNCEGSGEQPIQVQIVPPETEDESVTSADEGETRKRRKPKHGDDSKIIGMEITFDPTSELLELGTEPQCIKRTKLGKLQGLEVYHDSLLGDRVDEESSSSFESFTFHAPLHDMPTPGELNVSTEEHSEIIQEDIALPESPQYEEIEIVFVQEDDGSYANFYDTMNRDAEEMEIVFSTESVSLEENSEDEFFPTPSEHSSTSSVYLDCRTTLSPMPPQTRDWEDESQQDAPPYEWFHPDHVNVVTKRHNSPVIFFEALLKGRNCEATMTGVDKVPQDLAERSSVSSETSITLLSANSDPSDTIERLLGWCHPTALEERQ